MQQRQRASATSGGTDRQAREVQGLMDSDAATKRRSTASKKKIRKARDEFEKFLVQYPNWRRPGTLNTGSASVFTKRVIWNRPSWHMTRLSRIIPPETGFLLHCIRKAMLFETGRCSYGETPFSACCSGLSRCKPGGHRQDQMKEME